MHMQHLREFQLREQPPELTLDVNAAMNPLARSSQFQISHADSMQVNHPITHLFDHPADLPVLSFHQNNPETTP
jgi:hypothetical protein